MAIIALMYIWNQRYSENLFKDSNDLPTDKNGNKVLLKALLGKIEAGSKFIIHYHKKGNDGGYLPIMKEMRLGESPIKRRSLAGASIFFHEYGHYAIWEKSSFWTVGFLVIPRLCVNTSIISTMYAFGLTLSIPLWREIESEFLVGSAYLYWLQGISFFMSCCLLVILIEEILASLIGYQELKKYFLLKKKDKVRIMEVYITGLISYITPVAVSLIIFLHWWKLG